MSRLAKKPIKIPNGVTVNKDGNYLVFRGSNGEIKKKLPRGVEARIAESAIVFSAAEGEDADSAMLGTAASLAKSAISGVGSLFEKKLEIEGIGYKAQLEGQTISLSIGLTHPVKISIPIGVSAKIEKNTIILSGLDKEMVGGVAAEIRSKKPPEPYKGKGIHYVGEIIRRKAGKKAVAAA